MASIKRGLSQVYCLFRRWWSRLVDYIYDHLRCHNPAYKPKDGAGQHINLGHSFFNSSLLRGFTTVRVNHPYPTLLLLPRPDFCHSWRNAINLPFLTEQSDFPSPGSSCELRAEASFSESPARPDGPSLPRWEPHTVVMTPALNGGDKVIEA